MSNFFFKGLNTEVENSIMYDVHWLTWENCVYEWSTDTSPQACRADLNLLSENLLLSYRRMFDIVNTEKICTSCFHTVNSWGKPFFFFLSCPSFPSWQPHLHFDTGVDFSRAYILCCCCTVCVASSVLVVSLKSLTFSWHLVSLRLYQASVWAATAMNWHETCCSFALDGSMPPSFLMQI